MSAVPALGDAPVPRPNRADGLSAAIALLTATVPIPGSSREEQDEALLALVPENCPDLVDLVAGLYAVAQLLLVELSESSGESMTAPLQRAALGRL